MGIEAAIVAQVASGVISGIAASRAGKAQQKLFKEQAELVRKEAKRDAGRLRLRHKADNARIKLQAFKQGVAVQGSIANTLATNENLQDEEARAIIARGNAQSSLLITQGINARNEGRAALLSGIISGVSQGLSTIVLTSTLNNLSTIQPDSGTKSLIQPAGTFDKFGGVDKISDVFLGTN